MITMVQGDLLAVTKGIIVHGCNCVGVMGAGVALQVSQKWPAAEKLYREKCQDALDPKMLLGTIDVQKLHYDLYLVNAFTQLRPGGGRQVSYDAVTSCFEAIRQQFDPESHLPVCFPLIGCGLAGGKWPIVAAIIDETLPLHDKLLFVL